MPHGRSPSSLDRAGTRTLAPVDKFGQPAQAFYKRTKPAQEICSTT
eukprot:CAMPEP_0181447380 /NCGR_PEP_ID=MMETSP1110-20121109/26591_1 /TAXON_ID=174948 /ORGANISM="Symbiodinium sp., Strain CCMP421" /LENGTH=45 /DNA_ID= /DNA_START= /DNA_END= /DNA_ORIENTATION=